MKKIYWSTILLIASILPLSACSSSPSYNDSSYDGSSYTQDSSYADENNVEVGNPYDQDTGHYAGYQWAEDHPGSDCSGNSQSFNEGCEEYNQQQDELDQSGE